MVRGELQSSPLRVKVMTISPPMTHRAGRLAVPFLRHSVAEASVPPSAAAAVRETAGHPWSRRASPRFRVEKEEFLVYFQLGTDVVASTLIEVGFDMQHHWGPLSTATVKR
eukprot:scaffold1163_cov362-Prasinococcus_capsulatus_cf.AAC.17